MHECTRGKTKQRGAGQRKESLQRSLMNFHFHPGNPETLQSVKTVTTSAPFNGISLRLDEVEMRIYERSLQALLSSASRSLARTTARLARFARPNGELARRLISLCRVKVLVFIWCFKYSMDLTRLTKHIPEATPVSFEQSRFSDWAPAGDSELGWWTLSLFISSWQNKSITGWLWATSRLIKPR